MRQTRDETYAIREEPDLLLVRQVVRECLKKLGFRTLAQTKALTAVSELVRNTLIHGGGGEMRLEVLDDITRQGIRLTFQDEGPGIEDIDQAMVDGFTTGKGMGRGLGGTKRLVDEFEISSTVGEGTCIKVTLWT